MTKSKLKFSAINEFGEDTSEFKQAFDAYQKSLEELDGLYLLVKPEDIKEKKKYYVTDKSKYKQKVVNFTKVQDAISMHK